MAIYSRYTFTCLYFYCSSFLVLFFFILFAYVPFVPQGRILHVIPSRIKKEKPEQGPNAPGSSSYKRQKDAKDKAASGRSATVWKSTFSLTNCAFALSVFINGSGLNCKILLFCVGDYVCSNNIMVTAVTFVMHSLSHTAPIIGTRCSWVRARWLMPLLRNTTRPKAKSLIMWVITAITYMLIN